MIILHSKLDSNTKMSYGQRAISMVKNKVVLITGASAGIGRATAFELADVTKGNIKLILAARRKEKLGEISKELKTSYPSIEILELQLDISNIQSIQPFVKSIPSQFQDIDVLINNAGLALGRDNVGEIPEDYVTRMFSTNVLGLVTMTQAILPIMKKKNRGDIVNIGSVAGRDPYSGGGIYCSTKASVRSFTDVLRKELTDTKIRIIEIDPGNVETEFSNVRYNGDLDAAKKVYAGTEPLIAEDIAEIIVFAISRKLNTVIAETLVFSTNQASSRDIYRET